MFTYLNPAVRKKLVAAGKLVRIDAGGKLLNREMTTTPKELVINMLGPIPLPLHMHGNSCLADWYATVRSTELCKVEELANTLRQKQEHNLFASLALPMAVNSVLIIGKAMESDNPLVRVHSNCLTGDVFGSQRCECGPQLATAVERMSHDESGGIIIYMAGHEGRGIGLWAKAATYLLQDAGENTYQANQSLGLPADSRDFTDAAALILYFLGNRPMRLLTNNPKKIGDLRKAGLTCLNIEKHVTGITNWNRSYLHAKQQWGHHIENTDLQGE